MLNTKKMHKINRFYSYDDVLILPTYSNVVPSQVDLSTSLTPKIRLRVPVVASPMDTVTELKMAQTMNRLGGAAVIHKNMPFKDQIKAVHAIKNSVCTATTTVGLDGKPLAAVAVSPKITPANLNSLVKSGVDVLVVDSAHGHSYNVIKTARLIRKKYPKIQLIVGNVATKEAARALAKIPVDAIRVGIGPGAICTTRVVTGIGVPQLSAVMECAKGLKGTQTKLIADGGIKTSGDIVKAILAGADCVMVGAVLAGTAETPGEIIHVNNKNYKTYRGMGSIGAMKHGSADRYGQANVTNPEKLVPEGVEGVVHFKGPAENVVFKVVGGVKAGLSYCGAANINTFRKKGVFVEITSAGQVESHPHSIKYSEKEN